MIDFISRISSRKFLLALLGVVVVFYGHLDAAQITAITALIVAYTGADALINS